MTISVNSDNDPHPHPVPAASEAAPAQRDPSSEANEQPTGNPGAAPSPQPNPQASPEPARGGAATAVRPQRAPVKPEPLRPWRVVLHNDDRNDMDYVVDTIVKIVRLNRPSATRCMMEAHRKGAGQVIATHRERAEFIAEQLRSRRLTVTIEPVE